MSYVERILEPGESILATGRLHWVILLPSILVMVLALAVAVGARAAIIDPGQARLAYAFAGVLMVFGILAFLGRMMVRWATEFAVTNRRVIVKRGLFSLHTVEMNADKVESVDVDQTILGRLLGYGTVTIHGVGARWDPIERIDDPMKFRSAITTR